MGNCCIGRLHDFAVDSLQFFSPLMKPLVGKGQIHQIGFLPKISLPIRGRSGDIPEAYILPTIEPADVPVTILTGILFSFQDLNNPDMGKPLDAPPPKPAQPWLLVWVRDAKPYFDPA